MKITDRVATPTIVLFAFTFITEFFNVLWATRGFDPGFAFDLLGRVAFVWLLWWWLMSDSRRLGVTWPMDLGFFIFIAGLLLVPYHLIKARGPKGLIGIAAFLGVFIAGRFLGAIVGILLS